MTSDVYGERFFAHMASRRPELERFAECIWTAIDGGAGMTVLDLGCGNGTIIGWMKKRGAEVMGYDLYGEGPDVTRADLASLSPSALSAMAFAKLVLCTEVAEHLPESAADTLVELCAKCATHEIVWSAAPPGQDGDGHINCQPPAYWLDKFAAHGWEPHMMQTLMLRRLMGQRGAEHASYRENFYVLRPVR